MPCLNKGAPLQAGLIFSCHSSARSRTEADIQVEVEIYMRGEPFSC